MEYVDRWNPKRRGRNFHPSNQRQNDVSSTMDVSLYSSHHSSTGTPKHTTQQEIYKTIKKLASFISRKGVTAESIRKLAHHVNQELTVTHGAEVPDIHNELLALSEAHYTVSRASVNSNLYSYLYQFFNIHVHDKEVRNPRHQCTRAECKEWCILPLYANRCMSHAKIAELFEGLKRIIDMHPDLISETESATARNLLIYLACQGNPVLKDTYDVLFAMSGSCKTIFDPQAFVDSKLYELMICWWYME